MATSKRKSGTVVTNPKASANRIPRAYHLQTQPQVLSGAPGAPVDPVTIKPRSTAKPGEVITSSARVKVTGPPRTQMPKKGNY